MFRTLHLLLGLLRSAHPAEEFLRPCSNLILHRVLFLGELHLDEKDTGLSQAGFTTPLQAKVLAYVSEYLSEKQDGGKRRAVALLKKVVQGMSGLSPDDVPLREASIGLLRAMASSRTQKKVSREVVRRFGVESGAFCHYLRSTVFLSMGVLWSVGEAGEDDTPGITSRLLALASASMREYIAVLTSAVAASWGSSNSFDETDIRLTRPGLGVVALLSPDQSIHRIRDLLEPLLLLRTRDAMVHMTVFQAFLTFERDRYDPLSLPVNLLELFKAYMDGALAELFDEVASQVSSQTVRLSGKRLVLGRDYPSHLVAEVECKEVGEAMWRLKERSNSLGRWWMMAVADELRSRGFEGTVSPGATGATLEGRGWKLAIGYTSNRDYRTHVTLGVLKSGDPRYDDLAVRANADVTREIGPVFLPDCGKACNAEMAAELEEAKNRMRRGQLQRMDPSELSDYPLLRKQVESAKRGAPIEFGADVLGEWLRLKAREIDMALGEMTLSEEERRLYTSGIHESVINMDRIQNFEAVRPSGPLA